MVQFGVEHRLNGTSIMAPRLPTTTSKKIPGWVYGHIALLLVYFLLAIILTWPTVTQIATHLPGDGGDDPAIAWNLWWVKFALLNQGQNPFLTDYMFYPTGINLAFYTLTVLNAVTALPLTLNLGVVTASNLHMLFTFVLGAYGAFLLVRYLLTTDSRPPTAECDNGDRVSGVGGLVWIAAAIAGGVYAFASNKLFYVALGQFNIASTHWIPFAVLYVIRMGHQPNRFKNALLAGLFLTLQTWAEMTYATFVLVFIGLYWLVGIIIYANDFFRDRQVPSPLPYLRAAGMMVVTFTLGISPILFNMLPGLTGEDYALVEGSGFADAFSADLLGFVIPTMLHPWWGDWVTQTNIVGYDKGQHIYLGLTLLGLLFVSLITGYRNRAIRFWLITTAVFALLCLGPTILVNGQSTGIPGPFVILQQLPFFNGNRYPSRFSVMLILSLSVLAGFALVKIGEWLRQRTTHDATRAKFVVTSLLLSSISLLFLLEHLSFPLPQSDMRIPAAYQTIINDPDDFTVLDIPFAWRNGFRITGAFTTQFMAGQFYQTAHQKQMLQGNTSRNPAFKFQYFTNAPIINSLLALETGKDLPPNRWEGDRSIAPNILNFFNIRYIVVRPEAFNPYGHYPQDTIPYIENVLPVEKIHDDDAIKIYKVTQTAPPPDLYLNPFNLLTSPYFGEGWGLQNADFPISIVREQARLFLPLTGGPQRITLAISSEFPQSMWLELNGWQSPPQQIDSSRQAITFDLPAEAVQPGLNSLVLHFDQSTNIPPAPPIKDITVVSAGEDVGGFGHIYVNGHDVSLNQRGYNIAIIRANGDIQAASFDTHFDPAASAALAQFITDVPSDAIVAVAAADEASANLTEEAVLALQSIGASGDLRGCFRCSHALIGYPAAGMAQESLDALKPVGATTGFGLTEPSFTATVGGIQVETVEE